MSSEKKAQTTSAFNSRRVEQFLEIDRERALFHPSTHTFIKVQDVNTWATLVMIPFMIPINEMKLG